MSTKLVPLTTRPASTSRQGITRFRATPVLLLDRAGLVAQLAARRAPDAVRERPRLELLREPQQLAALVGGQVAAWPALRLRDQSGEPVALVALEQAGVVTHEDRHLRDR